MNSNQVTKDMLISDVLNMDGRTAQFFLNMGMHCLGCPAARQETIEQACEVHEVDADELVDEINSFLSSK